jgi:hypothetical protein
VDEQELFKPRIRPGQRLIFCSEIAEMNSKCGWRSNEPEANEQNDKVRISFHEPLAGVYHCPPFFVWPGFFDSSLMPAIVSRVAWGREA